MSTAGNQAGSGSLAMWIHNGTDFPLPVPSYKSARANVALFDHSKGGTVPVEPEASQHQLETLDGHFKSADAHDCHLLTDAARQEVSPGHPGTIAAEEPASECVAAVSQGGEGIMARYLTASQDQLGTVHGNSDLAGERWQRVGASSEGKLDDVVYARTGKGGGVQSVYDGDFDGSMIPWGKGETHGVCQSDEKTQE